MPELRGTWEDPAIVNDPRIDDHDPTVRAVAQMLHGNESMHMHQDIPAVICVYCALRTSRVLRWAECECREKLAGENGPIVGSLAKIMRAIEEAKC